MATSTETTAITNPNNGGDLFKLPPEVRDEIYRYLVKRTYIITQPLEWCTDSEFIETAILRVSKAISTEAIRVMYGESVFKSYLRLYRGGYKVGSHMQQPKEVSDRMMNLEYCISYHSTYSRNYAYFESYMQLTIERFTGTDVTRKHMEVRLYLRDDCEEAHTSLLLEVFKRLGGLRTVRLVIGFLEGTDVVQLNRDRMNERMQAVKAQLEPAIGPPTLASLVVLSTITSTVATLLFTLTNT